MKELKLHRNYKDKFTVTMSFDDYDAFPHEGFFPTVYQYFKVDSEEELISELLKEDDLLDECIESIYYNHEDVTDRYLDTIPYRSRGNKLLECWKHKGDS